VAYCLSGEAEDDNEKPIVTAGSRQGRWQRWR